MINTYCPCQLREHLENMGPYAWFSLDWFDTGFFGIDHRCGVCFGLIGVSAHACHGMEHV